MRQLLTRLVCWATGHLPGKAEYAWLCRRCGAITRLETSGYTAEWRWDEIHRALRGD